MEIHPRIQSAYEENRHPLSGNHFFSNHAREHYFPTFQSSKQNVIKYWNEPGFKEPEVISLLANLVRVEKDHKKELEELAVNIVSSLWQIDKSKLVAKLEKPPSVEEEEEGGEEEEEEETDEEIKKHIQHRNTMNMITQGYGIVSYNTLHYMGAEKLEEMYGPETKKILKDYSKIATAITHLYWMQSLEGVGASAGKQSSVGRVKVHSTGNGSIVIAYGICFPVLLHELVKGVVDLITTNRHFSGKSQEFKTKVRKAADKFEHEPWNIQMGPAFVNKLSKVIADANKKCISIYGKPIEQVNKKIPSSNRIKSKIIAAFAKKDPDETNSIITAIMDYPEIDIAVDLILELLNINPSGRSPQG